MSKRAYTVFIEDKEYLLWQLELFLFSITKRGGIDPKDIFVFWSCPEYYNKLGETQDPATVVKSEWLHGILESYPTMRHFYSQNFGRQNRCFRFMGKGKGFHGVQYAGINKWSSWIEYANDGCFDEYDEVVILEQDLWFSGKFPEIPNGNWVSKNWIPNRKESFAKSADPERELDEWAKVREFTTWEHEGWDLDEIMKLTKVPKEQRSLWTRGAVLFQFVVKDLTPKFLNDLMNYQYLLLHMGEIAHPTGKIHETDMIAPSLACCNNNIKLAGVEDEQLLTETWCKEESYEQTGELPEGTIVHYAWDFSKYPFLSNTDDPLQFSKFTHGGTHAPWQGNIPALHSDIKKSKYEWLRNYYNDMIEIGKSYPYIRRNCYKEVGNIRI